MRGIFIVFIIQQKAWFVTKLFYENIFYAAEKIFLIKHKNYYKINYNSIDCPNAVATFWQPLYTILRITMIHINKKRPDLGVFLIWNFFIHRAHRVAAGSKQRTHMRPFSLFLGIFSPVLLPTPWVAGNFLAT